MKRKILKCLVLIIIFTSLIGCGSTGPQGDTGNGISSITLTESKDLVDTYTIYYTDGSTTTFTVTNGKDGAQGIQGIQGEPGKDGHTPVITIENGNWYIDGVDTLQPAQGLKGETGNGISSIILTESKDLVDTYTIYYTDGSTTTFTVTNGKDGSQGIQGEPGKDGHTPVITIENGNWYIDGVDTGKQAQGLKGETGNGISSIILTKQDGLVDTYTIYYTDGSTTTFTVTNGKDGSQGIQGETGNGISSIKLTNTDGLVDTYTIYFTDGSTTTFTVTNGKDSNDNNSLYSINNYYMINDGLTELAANAVELVIDDKTGIAYACYLASETSYGESSSIVKIAKFNILQPTNIKWVTVFDKSKDFNGHSLSECNIIDLDDSTVRVFVIDLSTQQYFYKDVDKKTLNVKDKKEVMIKENDESTPLNFNTTNINTIISNMGGQQFNYLQFTSKIIKIDGYYYTTVCGGNAKRNFLFMKSVDGITWTICSLVNHFVNYEAMLEYYDGKFWIMCRNGGTKQSDNKQQNLLYSEDGINWTQSNLALETSDTRPYLFQYQGELFLAYSSPLDENYSTVRNWRCNIHIGKIISKDGIETFEEMIYKQSKFGIVYYALTDWYGKMIMLYSSGELHPTEGIMGGWSQGKDCLNYTVLYTEEPQLKFKSLTDIVIDTSSLKLKYSLGEPFDASGLIVKAKYEDDSYMKVSNYRISTPDMTTIGVKSITVTYTENGVTRTASFEVEVIKDLKIYDEISAVQSTNEQYIKTNLTTTKETQIIIKMMKPTNENVIDENGRWLFGSGSRNFGLCLKPNGKYVLDVGGIRYQEGTINWQEGINTLILGNGVYTLNGGPISDNINIISEVIPASDLRILGNPSSGFNTYLGAIISEIIIFNGNIEVMHLIPAISNENNRVGFYDLVTKRMIYSATSIDFYEAYIDTDNE